MDREQLKAALYQAYEAGINDYRSGNGYSSSHNITLWEFEFEKWFNSKYPEENLIDHP